MPSIIKQFSDSLGMHTRNIENADSSILAQEGESLATGLILGAMHATHGLDIKGKIPGDLLLSVGSLALASRGGSLAPHLRNASASAITAFGFRQGFAFMSEKRKAAGQAVVGGFTPLVGKGSAMHGEGDFGEDIGEDPIVSLAKEL